MQLSEQLARAITSMGRLITDFQGEELSRTDFLVLVRLPLADETGQPCVRATWLARRASTPRR